MFLLDNIDKYMCICMYMSMCMCVCIPPQMQQIQPTKRTHLIKHIQAVFRHRCMRVRGCTHFIAGWHFMRDNYIDNIIDIVIGLESACLLYLL